MPAPIRKYWFADDPFKSLVFDAFSVSVPIAERFLAETAKLAKLGLPDGSMKHAAGMLIHEEEAHTRVHVAYNDLLRRQGYRIEAFEEFERRAAAFLACRSLETRLALCSVGEYFTTVLGRHVLERRTLEDGNVDERMRAIWTWHSLEELDHRGTAFGLYLAYGGGYLRRILALAVLGSYFFINHALCFRALAREDKLRFTKADWSAGLGFLFGRAGLYTSVFRHCILFLKPGFHPLRDVSVEHGLAGELHHYHVEEHFVGAVSATS